MALTTDQLQTIDRHLRKDNWLLNEALIAELTDHYVAGIEDRMQNGVPFETALMAVHAGFGGRKGLLAVEEKTSRSAIPPFFRDFIRILLSYARPPRLVYSLGLLAFAYWANQEKLVIEWGRTMHAVLYSTLAIVSLYVFANNGFRYVNGKRKYIKPYPVTALRGLWALNMPTIFNGILVFSSLPASFSHFSLLLQTSLCFCYLLIWAVIIEFISTAFAQFRSTVR